jgi:hypothetical protein
MTERLKKRIGEYIDRRKEVSVKITTKFEGQGAIVSDRKKQIRHESTALRNDSRGNTAPARMEGQGALAMN